MGRLLKGLKMDTCTQCVFFKQVGCIKLSSENPTPVPDPDRSTCNSFFRNIHTPITGNEVISPMATQARAPQMLSIGSLPEVKDSDVPPMPKIDIPTGDIRDVRPPKACNQVSVPYTTIRRATVKVNEPIRLKLIGSYTVVSLDPLKCTAVCRSDITGMEREVSFEEWEPESLVRQPEILAHEYGDGKAVK